MTIKAKITAILESATQFVTYFQHMGRAFGYPQCCVKNFEDIRDQGLSPGEVIGDGPWIGSGFIPCPTHAKQLRDGSFEDVCALIDSTGTRTVRRPFPDVSREEIDRLIAEYDNNGVET